MSGKLLTPEQVIDLLALDDGCGPDLARERLRHRLRARQIPYVQIGKLIRFREGDIEALLQRVTVGAAV
jgi:hypothetical protein